MHSDPNHCAVQLIASLGAVTAALDSRYGVTGGLGGTQLRMALGHVGSRRRGVHSGSAAAAGRARLP